jgi:hypothetical protein
VQWQDHTLVDTWMADPLITAAGNHLIKPFQPTQSGASVQGASVQFNERRIHNFADRRIPADPHVSGYRIEDVHSPCRDD